MSYSSSSSSTDSSSSSLGTSLPLSPPAPIIHQTLLKSFPPAPLDVTLHQGRNKVGRVYKSGGAPVGFEEPTYEISVPQDVKFVGIKVDLNRAYGKKVLSVAGFALDYGVAVGDLLVAVNGKDLKGWDLCLRDFMWKSGTAGDNVFVFTRSRVLSMERHSGKRLSKVFPSNPDLAGHSEAVKMLALGAEDDDDDDDGGGDDDDGGGGDDDDDDGDCDETENERCGSQGGGIFFGDDCIEDEPVVVYEDWGGVFV